MSNVAERKEIAKFQRNLETLRQIAGWTAEDVAEKIGVNKQTIRNLELAVKAGRDGKPEMSKLQYIGLRSVFECEASTNDLLGKVMPILLNPEEAEDEAMETEEKVLTVAAAKAGGASDSSVIKVLKAMFPIVPVAGGLAGAWLINFLKAKK